MYLKISLPADEQFELLPFAILTRLICAELFELDSDIKEEISIILPNLKYLVIKEDHMSFDEFEIFIKKISSQLQVLRMNTFEDEIYIDPDRWKQLTYR
jgi:hypothetical protein